MEYSFQEIIRETKNAINSRLDMLESLISTKKICTVNINTESLNERMSYLENMIRDLQKEDIPEVVIIEKDSRDSFEESVNPEPKDSQRTPPSSISGEAEAAEAEAEAEEEEEEEAEEEDEE